MELRTDPVSVKLLGRLIGRSSPSKGIENDITGPRGDQNSPFRDHRLQFVHARADFEFRVAVGGCIGPEIRQIDSFRIHFLPVSAVVPDFLATVSAFFDGQTNFVKYTRISTGIIKKCIVSRIQLFPARICALHGQCDPVPEIHLFSHDRSKSYRKFRCGVEEKGASWLQYSTAFEDPLPAPSQVLVPIHGIDISILVILAKVERWVGKYGIDYLRFHVPEEVLAIRVVKDSVRRGQVWLFHPADSRHVIRSGVGHAPWRSSSRHRSAQRSRSKARYGGPCRHASAQGVRVKADSFSRSSPINSMSYFHRGSLRTEFPRAEKNCCIKGLRFPGRSGVHENEFALGTRRFHPRGEDRSRSPGLGIPSAGRAIDGGRILAPGAPRSRRSMSEDVRKALAGSFRTPPPRRRCAGPRRPRSRRSGGARARRRGPSARRTRRPARPRARRVRAPSPPRSRNAIPA